MPRLPEKYKDDKIGIHISHHPTLLPTTIFDSSVDSLQEVFAIARSNRLIAPVQLQGV